MANYVYQQVICSKEFLEKYLLDYYPIGDQRRDPPYISFNKIVGVRDIGEYREKYGEYIYYGYGFTYRERADGRYTVKFATKRDYPIPAIEKSIQLDHQVKWYAVEESCIYVSRFEWRNGIQERVVLLDESFDDWYGVEETNELGDTLEDCDHLIWYYLAEKSVTWQVKP
ncbi:hypothetical protein [Streptococcus sp. sy018]|uniref:hypothetical protein n=1 Tax=Streptococcus sp. sy018 TaxID=2600147 RepID=UPI0011B544B3|nr:hypothetical protein [Streptococcus sp. sy018]TWS95355.1 hypothetical protein FRX52_00705 [Streptococcus sp. sy018]